MCLLAEEVFSSREEYRLIMNYIYYCIYYCIYYSQVHLWRLLAEDTLKSGLTLDPSCPATEALVMQVVMRACSVLYACVQCSVMLEREVVLVRDTQRYSSEYSGKSNKYSCKYS